MKANDQTFSDFLHVLRRRARPAALVALAVLLGMIVVTFSMPAIYESHATLLIEHPDIPQEALGGTGLDGYVEQRLQRTRQRVTTTENVQRLIDRHKLFQSGRDSGLTEEERIGLFNDSVVVTPQVTGVIDPRSMRTASLTYAFDVGFRYSDPGDSRDVANALAELFIESSELRARADAETTIGFLRTEADRLQADLRDRETRLADFRQAHPSGLPGSQDSNLDRVRELERDLARVDDDLRAARARRELLATQLLNTPRDRPVLDQTGEPVIRGAERLAAAQQELVAALAKYSEDHPDVRRLRREIASLSAETAVGPAAAPSNPAYLQIQTQIGAADVEIRELMGRRYELSGSKSRLQGAIFESPRLEKQYTDLVRDYELIKSQYDKIREQQTTAELGLKAAGTQAVEKYVLINEASLPTSPIEPDRVSLMFLAAVLSTAAGLGTASLLNSADRTIRGNADVIAIAGAPPLADVPVMRTSVELRRRRVGDTLLVGGALATVALVILALR